MPLGIGNTDYADSTTLKPADRCLPLHQRHDPARRSRAVTNLHRESEQQGPRRRRLVQMGDVLKTRNLRRGKNLVSLEIA